MNLDTAFDKLGIFGGFFPVGTFLLIGWCAFSVPLLILYPAFLGFLPTIRDITDHPSCDAKLSSTSNDTIPGSIKQFICPGNKTFYCIDQNDQMQVHSIAVQWDLACDQSYLIPLCKSFIFIGFLVGCTFAGPVMDKYGRKNMMVISTFLAGIFAIISAFVNGVVGFLIVRVIIGTNAIAMFLGGYLMVTEMVSSNYRGQFSMAYTIPWATATSILPVIAYYLPSNRDMTLAIGVPNLFFSVLLYIILPESPSWMLTNDRRIQVENYLIKQGEKRKNKVILTPGFLADEEQMIKKKKEEATVTGPLTILRSKMYLKFTILMCLVWNIDAAFYHGLNFSSTTGKDPYVSLAISGISELVGYFAAVLVTRFCTRKKPTIILHILAALFTFCIPIIRSTVGVENGHGLGSVMALNMLAKFCITISFVLVWLYACEIVHTNLRSTVVAVCEFMSRVGSFLAPFLVYLGEQTSPAAPEILVGVLSIIGAILVVPFPETAFKPLPSTKDDVRALVQKSNSRMKANTDDNSNNLP